jgi:hypothetical protein
MSTTNIIRARGYGPSMSMHDQSLPGTGTGPPIPSDRKVNRRDAEEPQPREQNNAGGRTYVLSLPAGEYRGEDDEASGLMHIHRGDAGGRGGTHVCSVPAGQYDLERDEAGVHLFKVPDKDDEERGERESEEAREPEEHEERDQGIPGVPPLPRPAGLGRGRDIGPTEYQRLRSYRAYLKQHYDGYRQWLHNRSAER